MHALPLALLEAAFALDNGHSLLMEGHSED